MGVDGGGALAVAAAVVVIRIRIPGAHLWAKPKDLSKSDECFRRALPFLTICVLIERKTVSFRDRVAIQRSVDIQLRAGASSDVYFPARTS